VIVRTREPAPPTAPPVSSGVTVQEVADTARSRFELELERARARSAERAAERPPTVEAPPPPVVESTGRRAIRVAPRSAASSSWRRASRSPSAPGRGRPAAGQAAGPPGHADPRPVRRAAGQGRPRGGPGGRDFGKKKLPFSPSKGKGAQPLRTTPAEHKRVIRMEETIAISDLARGMGVKATEVLKKLWSMGMAGVNINASIDFETAQIIASEFGYEVQNVAFQEQDAFKEAPDDATSWCAARRS
jgi:translation initiation factor IF-2